MRPLRRSSTFFLAAGAPLNGHQEPVKTLLPSAPVGFVTERNRTLTPLAERFIECARKVAGSISAARRAHVLSAQFWSVPDDVGAAAFI
jgi:hypothetical protein